MLYEPEGDKRREEERGGANIIARSATAGHTLA